jgi:hypothetical protein
MQKNGEYGSTLWKKIEKVGFEDKNLFEKKYFYFLNIKDEIP